MKSILAILFITANLCTSLIGLSNVPYTIETDDRQLIKSDIYYFKDSSQKLSLDEVVQKNFRLYKKGVPSFSLTQDHVWLRLTLSNTTDTTLFAEIGHPILNSVIVYDTLDRKGNPITFGQNNKFSERRYNFTHFVFDLSIDPGQTKTYFFKIHSNTQIQFPLFTGSYENIKEFDQKLNVFGILFIGIMLAMALYNLFIYFIVRDSSYLYYVLFVITITVVQLVPKGLAYQFFWPDLPQLANAAVFLSPALSGITSILFFFSFLKVKENSKKIYQLLLVCIGSYMVGLIIFLWEGYAVSYTILDMTSLLASLILLVGAVIIYKKGQPSALIFLIAWSIFLTGVVVFVLKELGILPYNNLTNYTMFIGSALETFLLSIGLANRINIYRKEKDVAQRNELHLLKENERIIKQSNIELEQKVKERTSELEMVNTELKDTLVNLKNAQQKLIESEKMASLGHLTAGIAHEINNPINFVFSNVTPLKQDIKEITEFVELYGELNPENFNTKIKEIKSFKEDIDYDYLKGELNDLIKGIEEGANRTSEIVKGLKSFSRIDDQSKVYADVREGLDSTLLLLSNKLDNINVEKNYTEIPAIECFPGKLNQAFMNFLSNAVDAVEEKFQSKSGGKIIIDVSKEDEGKSIKINITDNGVGIPEEEQSKILDPFYTTKEVGKGTGLGLSISYNIIKAHHGTLDIISEKNKSTTVQIKIPTLSSDET